MSIRGWMQAAVLAAAIGAGTAPLRANDTCAAAQTITAPGTYAFDTTGSAIDSPSSSCEQTYWGFPTAARWFKYTASETGEATVFVPANFDLIYGISLTVFDGCGGDELLCIPETTYESAPSAFNVVGGNTYIIRVATYIDPEFPEYGGSTLELEEIASDPHPNDTCNQALMMSEGVLYSWNNAGALTDTNVVCSMGEGTHNDIFFSFVAPASTQYDFATVIDSAPVLTLLTGTCGALIEVECQSIGGYSNGARISRIMTAGERVYIRIASDESTNSQQGGFVVVNADTPPNDTCGSATNVNVGTTTFTNGGAFIDSSICVQSAQDVYFRFQPSTSGRYRIDTCGSIFDTVLSLSTSCGTALVCDDNGGTCSSVGSAHPSQITVDLRAGVPVIIRVAGLGQGSEHGLGKLNISLVQAISNPANDTCASAASISVGQQVSVPAIALGTNDSSGCGGLSSSPDLWYQFTPNFNGFVKIDTCENTAADTALSVYTACGGASVECNTDGCGQGSEVILAVNNGTNYRIRLALDSYSPISSATLRLTPILPPPTNDVCNDAAAIMDGTHFFDTALASTELPADGAWNVQKDVWFSYTAPTAGSLKLTASRTLGSVFNRPKIEVFNLCGQTFIARSIDIANSGSLIASVNMCVAAGQEIVFRIGHDNFQGVAGPGMLQAEFSPSSGYVLPTAGSIMEAETCAGRVGVTRDTVNGGYPTTAPFIFYTQAISCGQTIQGTIPQASGVADRDVFAFTRTSPVRDLLFIGSAEAPVLFHVAGFDGETPIGGTTSCSTSFTVRVTTSQQLNYDDPAFMIGSAGAGATGSCSANEEYWLRYFVLDSGAVTIASQPEDAARSLGQTATFSVDATGSGLGYIWRRGDVPLTNGGRYSGVNSPTLSITAITAQDIGSYNVIVTAGCDAAISRAAALSIQTCRADFNGDNARDVADLFAYINAWLAKTPNADFNADSTVDVADLFAYINAWLAGC